MNMWPSSSSIEADGENCREGEDVLHLYDLPLCRQQKKYKKSKISRYFICDEIVKIYLISGHSFIIDLDCLFEILPFNWSVEDDYVYRVRSIGNFKNVKIRLHRQIMRAEKHQIVDHINGNRFDNRKTNLRFLTVQQNNQNRKKTNFTTAKSKYKGVWKNKNRWSSTIVSDGKKYYLGNFETQEQAAEAYNDAAKKLHKEYARLNEIEV